jgi:hypothetical protein
MVNVRIRMEPQSLVVQVPFKWEINQIKCLLCTMIPKLEFGMVQLTHLREDLPGHMTLDEVLTGDWEE